MADEEDLPQEFETNIQCPSCGENLFIIYYSTRIAFEEGINIETYYCKKCLFKQSAITPHERGEPVHTSLRLRSPDDLKVVVYRSPEAVLQIPEIDAEILPGKAATGEITTIEGILFRLREKLDIVGDEAEDPEKKEKIREILDGALKGNRPEMTIVIDDPSGKSRINSSRAQRTRMEE